MELAKKITQFRYYGEGNGKNYPNSGDKSTIISASNLSSGGIFVTHKCLPIIQLGIQTLPGTKFYLNNATTPIVIGSTGIYELDLNNITEITHIAFDKASLNLINKTNNAYLIIDMIVEDN